MAPGTMLLAIGAARGGESHARAFGSMANLCMLGQVSDSLVGKQVGHFHLLAELGRGGMGVVYEARDEKLGRTVALKVLPAALASDRVRSDRFLREARAAARIAHAAITTVFEVGQSDGVVYIAMERIAGTTLRERIVHEGFAAADALAIAREVAGALAKAHAAGIVHRDLKPENVMLNEEGRVKILDFGISKALHDEGEPEGPTAWTTREGAILGTPGYMAPEQAAGKKCDQRADVFAWGVMLYELLTRRAPFSGDTPLQRVASVLRDEPAPLTDVRGVPDSLRELLVQCLAKNPDERPSDGAELARRVDALSAEARTVVRADPSPVDPEALTLAPGENGLASGVVQAVGPAPELAPAVAATAGSSTPAAGAGFASNAPRASTRFKRVAPWVALGVVLPVLGAGYWMKQNESARRERRSVASASAGESVPAAPAPASGTGREHLPPVWPCPKDVEVAKGHDCSAQAVAWCDPSGKRLACCGKGLIPTDRDGACGCPPGGTERGSPASGTCPVAADSPGLDRNVIRKVVQERYPDFKACRARTLAAEPLLSGKVEFAVRVSPDGRVYSAKIKESTLPSPDLQACLLDVWKQLRFGPTSGGSPVDFVYPVTFSAE